MRVLFLGVAASPLVDFLKSFGEEVLVTQEKITVEALLKNEIDFIVSCGYRHIVKPPVIQKYTGRIVNLHISYLPWNRGADPNLWSFIEKTPKGVTIHLMDEGVDTGAILFQKEVEFGPGETLKTSYDKLKKEIEELFKSHWHKIRSGSCPARRQEGVGSVHTVAQGKEIFTKLPEGYDTRVDGLDFKAKA